MEKETQAVRPEVRDYRECDRIWQRVAPALNPYPEARVANAAETAEAAERRTELSLPGAEENPCCMGTEALESVDVLEGFVREEVSSRRVYMMLLRCIPTMEGKRLFRTLVAEESRHIKKLLAALYLITGERYRPTICHEQVHYAGYCAAIRERYHEKACNGFNYHRAAQEALDPCLKQLLFELSEDEFRHANLLLDLLARAMG